MLECKNITKTFGDFKALDDVSVTVPEGKIFGLLGPNGAGKTTLIRIINRITIPTAGEVILNGKHVDDEDVRVYALKDQLARVANPKLHYTYRAQMDGGGNEESLRQAELSHESYLKFLESMEYVYQKIESGDDSVKVGGLPDRKTCANVMVMLRKIGDLPY